MKFEESVKVCFSKYADFTGTASRSEYWWFALAIFLGSAAASTVNQTLGALFSLAVLLPSLAAAARRLRDTGRTAWWLLIGLVPLLGLIVLIVLLAQPSSTRAEALLTAG